MLFINAPLKSVYKKNTTKVYVMCRSIYLHKATSPGSLAEQITVFLLNSFYIFLYSE